jgi:dTDP-4-dehydrorhamnose 3,5-epimerase
MAAPSETRLQLERVHVEHHAIPGMLSLTPRRFADARGFFSETFSTTWLDALGVDVRFMQDNHSVSTSAGTLRGFHYQAPPHAQAKLVRVTQGSALDVVLDLRVGSPTFGHHEAVELSARTWNQVLVPVGCAHAFCTLEPETHLLYKVSAPYHPESEGGIVWNDPELNVTWPTMTRYVISGRDRSLPRLSAHTSPFTYDVRDDEFGPP